MNVGLFGINSGICSNPDVARRVATRAEEAGLESLWTGEHVVLPDPRQPPSPAAPDYPMVHPSANLAFVAAVTERIKLGTGLTLIAQRNPLVLAKEMASLDYLSKGRLILGIGAGYLHQEFSALGVPFNERGARTDEAIEVMRTLWNDPQPAYRGQFWNFDHIQAMPRPAQQGGPPIVVGGTSEAALRRAARCAQGWYGFAMNVEQTKRVLDALHAIEGGSQLEISITPSLRINTEIIEEFAEVGVHRLISLMPNDESRILQLIEDLATTMQ